MEKFVLDTNLFFNTETEFGLGKKTDEVMERLVYYAERLISKVEFYMPPLIVNEFLSFFKDKNQPIIKKTLSFIKIKSPDRNKIGFPAPIFYLIISDIRKRSYQGLNIGEDLIKKTGYLFLKTKKELDKKGFETTIGPLIKNFRDRYRQATRVGFLDSEADMDLIVLAKEIDGFLVSSDEGVINWGRVFGVKEVEPLAFLSRLDFLLHQVKD